MWFQLVIFLTDDDPLLVIEIPLVAFHIALNILSFAINRTAQNAVHLILRKDVAGVTHALNQCFHIPLVSYYHLSKYR